ncbi:hypothetical protein BRD56_01475 [Thermoplasmatales archaeon SW_10_69_26]|nr:MAG: hypothetical protein BRD56_01475 [Thermoplasmatales archaeon SW_10_69_26]
MDEVSARLPLALAVLVLAAPLAGCIGTTRDDTVQAQNATDNVTEPEPTVGNPAEVYVAGTNASSALGNATGELPVGIGLPVPGPLFEPTIGVTSEGTLFVSNTGRGELTEEDPPPDTEYSSILRSTDDGETWEDVTGSVGPVSVPPETGDPYVYVDEETDRVYNLDMIGLNCNWVRFSDDAGDSWVNNPAGCGQPPVLDHPTIFAGDPTTLETTAYENVVYLCVNRVADSACATSLDGGVTWSPFRTVYPGAEADGSFCGGLHAHGTTGPEGTAYLPKGQCGTPTLAISQDNGLTWETVEITTEVPSVGHEVAIATDDQANVFAHWIGEDLHAYLAYSEDQGRTWSEPVDVTPPDVELTSHPTIAAGANGSVALAYVGTETAASGYGEVSANATWNGYITTVLDARTAEPTVTTVTANDPDNPLARGECGGTRCRAANDAGIGDFIDVTIDDDGRPWAAFVDVCLETCEQTGESVREEGIGFVGTLTEGSALVGDGALEPLDAEPPNATES